MSCEKDTCNSNERQFCSIKEMKSRLIKTGVDIKSEHVHVDIATACLKVEDSGIFELFEPDVNNHPLESLEIFDRNNERMRIMKESTPMKDMFPIIKDKTMTPNNLTSVMSILSSLLKIPTHDVDHATKSRCK